MNLLKLKKDSEVTPKDYTQQIAAAQTSVYSLQQRLSDTEHELSVLSQEAPPTTDLVAEEAAAIKRLAREHALNRVKAALNTELAQAKAQLEALKQAERAEKVRILRADYDECRRETIELLWTAYHGAEKWQEAAKLLEKAEAKIGSNVEYEPAHVEAHLRSIFQDFPSFGGNVTMDGNYKVTVVRIPAKAK